MMIVTCSHKLLPPGCV